MMTAARSPPPLELDAISERELDKLKQKVERLGKFLSASAFYVDRQRKKWEYGVTIVCTTKQSFTNKRHHTINVAPRDFVKSMTTGTLQMGKALVMVPADGSFATAIAKDNHKEGDNPGDRSDSIRG